MTQKCYMFKYETYLEMNGNRKKFSVNFSPYAELSLAVWRDPLVLPFDLT